jgi:hypothetical protein
MMSSSSVKVSKPMTKSEYLRMVIRQLQKQQAQHHLEGKLLEGLRTPTIPGTDQFWTGLETKAATRKRNRK